LKAINREFYGEGQGIISDEQMKKRLDAIDSQQQMMEKYYPKTAPSILDNGSPLKGTGMNYKGTGASGLENKIVYLNVEGKQFRAYVKETMYDKKA
jgi:hypothetical protein